MSDCNNDLAEPWTETQTTLRLRQLHLACQGSPISGQGKIVPWLKVEQCAEIGFVPQELAWLVAQGLLWQTESFIGLTPSGLALLEQSAEESAATAAGEEPRPRPSWVVSMRTLLLGPHVVKRLTATATTEIALLDALEACGWPARLANPLPGQRRIRTRRLREGARSLSKCQECRLLAFAVEEAEWLTWHYLE
jgi:hypothetical protein